MSEIPEWAHNRAVELGMAEADISPPDKSWWHNAFARYIAAHEEEPVEPLLIEAREICANPPKLNGLREPYGQCTSLSFLKGERDDHYAMAIVLAALKRGIELGQGK